MGRRSVRKDSCSHAAPASTSACDQSGRQATSVDVKTLGRKEPMRRLFLLLAALAAAAALTAGFASSASAYGGGSSHDMWQVGISFNCNNPEFCGDETGGFWGWVEFDRSADGTQTWGDAELAYCTDEILGFDAPPGVAIQIQVAFRPAK